MAADLARLRALSADSALVPQVYDYCDQWCERCGLAARCLALKWVQARGGGELADVYQDLSAAGNGFHPSVNPTILAAVASAGTHLDDPLETLARDYAARAHMFLRSLDPEPAAPGDSYAEPPTARTIVTRYHLLLAAKMFRAVAAAAVDPVAPLDATSDATGSAKIALVLAERSQLALAGMAAAANDSRVADLMASLERITRELVRRFPLAPSFVRPGFNDQQTIAVPLTETISIPLFCPSTS